MELVNLVLLKGAIIIDYHSPVITTKSSLTKIASTMNELKKKSPNSDFVRACWFVYVSTLGINYDATYSRPDLFDVEHSRTDNVNDINRVYGIEAARNFLLREISTTIANSGMSLDYRHIQLAANNMTLNGSIDGLTFQGISKRLGGLDTLLFERAMHTLGQVPVGVSGSTKSSAVSLTVGVPSQIGTGQFQILTRPSTGTPSLSDELNAIENEATPVLVSEAPQKPRNRASRVKATTEEPVPTTTTGTRKRLIRKPVISNTGVVNSGATPPELPEL